MKRKMMGIAVCLYALFMAGCNSTTGISRNPADNPDSTVPGVVRAIGREGAADGQFTLPESIVQDTAGNIYIADTFNDRIEKFDPFGNYILSWGSSGAEDGQFTGCRGLAIDSANNVYVTDVILHRVQKFDASGNFITKWGSEGTGVGEFSAPFDISADSMNNVYVVDANNNRIQKFDSSGRYLGQFGTQGAGDGQFGEPIGITIDRNDNIYIADGQNNRIQKFDRSMRFVAKWGGAGTGDGQFAAPYGLASDYAGNIYVTDLDNNRIQKFDATGHYLGKAAQAGYREGELYEPSDVIVDQFGNLYVVDGNNHRVQIFTQEIFTASVVTARQATVSAYVSATTARPTASWMKDSAASGDLGSKPLSTLLIPGTHDTGTYAIGALSDMADDGNFNGEKAVTDTTGSVTSWCDEKYWCKPAIGKVLHGVVNTVNKGAIPVARVIQAVWSISQDETILEQLNGGIRFLDLRVQALDDLNYAVVHSMVSDYMPNVLADIVTFCNNPDSSQEIILLAINKVYDMDGRHDKLVDLINKTLVNSKGESLLIKRAEPTAPSTVVTLNSLWRGTGRVIVFYPDAETVERNSNLWLKNAGDGNAVETHTTAAKNTFVSTLVNAWPKTKDSVSLSNITRTNRDDFLKSYPDDYSNYFYVSQLVRTQDGASIRIGIESEIFGLFINELKKSERYVFKKLWKWLGLHSNPPIGPTNLLDWGRETNDDVTGDFFQHADPQKKWNILMVDNYKKGPVDYVQQIISYNLQLE